MSSDRMTAADRREAILEAAVEEIARNGFAGATTADIARRAGISQPYVFRFFPTKKDLCLAGIVRYVVHQAERDGHEHPSAAAHQFLATGFLINAAMAIGLESELRPEEWSAICPADKVARVDDRLQR